MGQTKWYRLISKFGGEKITEMERRITHENHIKDFSRCFFLLAPLNCSNTGDTVGNTGDAEARIQAAETHREILRCSTRGGPFSPRWGLSARLKGEMCWTNHLLRWFSMPFATSNDYFRHLKGRSQNTKSEQTWTCVVCVSCLCDFHVWCHNAVGEVAGGCGGKRDRKRRKPSRSRCFICRNLLCQISVQWILAPFRVKPWKYTSRFQVPVKIGIGCL